MKTHSIILFIIFLGLFALTLNAQQKQNDSLLLLKKNPPILTDSSRLPKFEKTKYESKVIFEFYGLLSLPSGEFKLLSSNMWGLGLGGSVLYNPFTSFVNPKFVRPYVLGLQIDDTKFSKVSKSLGTTIQSKSFDLENTIKTKIYPFIVYQAGLRFFKGKQEIKYVAKDEADQSLAPDNFTESFEGSNTTYNGYGGGIGYGKGALRFELKMIKQKGAKATYLDIESIVVNADKTFSYKTKTTTTDMLLTELNISLRF
jgi:hypothetical protein